MIRIGMRWAIGAGVAVAMAGSLAGPASAARAAGWSAASCGREPAAPDVDTTSVERYNASVDRVTAYEKDARSYNACVSREAVAQQTAISREAKERIDTVQAGASAVQKHIANNFESLTAALRAGSAKLKGRH